MTREQHLEQLLRDQSTMRVHLLAANQALQDALNKSGAENKALLLQVNELQARLTRANGPRARRYADGGSV